MSFNMLRQILPDKLQELSKTEHLEAQSYLHNILDKHHRSNMHKFTENCYEIGKLTLHTLTGEEQKVISECGIILPSFQLQKLRRIMIKGFIFIVHFLALAVPETPSAVISFRQAEKLVMEQFSPSSCKENLHFFLLLHF